MAKPHRHSTADAVDLVDNYAGLSATIFGWLALLEKIPKVGKLIAPKISGLVTSAAALESLLKEVGPMLSEVNEKAREKQEYLQAILSQFVLDIDNGVRDGLFVKSRK